MDSDDILILPVPPSELIAQWQAIEPLISSALPCAMGRFLSIDVLSMCITGNAQGWLIRDRDDLLAVMITRIEVFPRRKCMSIFALAGREMHRFFAKANTIITDYARQMGCDSMEVQGRKAWERILDLEPRSTFLTKDILPLTTEASMN